MELNIEKITPEIAKRYLKANTDNYRKLNRSTVSRYASDMKAGRWQLNGEAIEFGKDGKLKNGQHRLAAVVVSGKPVEMVVIRGVDDSVTIYDSGANRSLTQIVTANIGEVNTTMTATANAIVGNFSVPTKAVAIEWIGKHYKELLRAYRASGATTNYALSKRMTCVLAAYLMMEARNMPYYEVELFFRIFNSGDSDGSDGYEPSGAIIAREMFLKRFGKGKSVRSTYKDQTEILTLALHDFQTGTRRSSNYQIKEPLLCLRLLSEIREAGDLE